MLRRHLETAASPLCEPNQDTDPKRVSILGATGSVGATALDLISHHPGRYSIAALTANTNVEQLASLARRHTAARAVIGDPTLYRQLKDALAGTSTEVAAGPAAVIEAGAMPADCVVCAIVGAAGLQPSLAAVGRAGRIALANKECLVSAGDVFMAEVARAGTELVPVDSEHAAIHQALRDEDCSAIERITITASGGPFRKWSKQQLEQATREQALRHPNWSMGAKITIDSATMMNKGLELIEAYHLFPVRHDQLTVVIHPQSIVHGLVSYHDGSVIAQLANPDMRTPIAHSLAWPRRLETPTPRLDLVKLAQLTFEAPDLERFPALALADRALQHGGSAPNVLNAANECAVAAFLERRIGFTKIATIVEDTLDKAYGSGLVRAATTLEDVLNIDHQARRLARDLMAAAQ